MILPQRIPPLISPGERNHPSRGSAPETSRHAGNPIFVLFLRVVLRAYRRMRRYLFCVAESSLMYPT